MAFLTLRSKISSVLIESREEYVQERNTRYLKFGWAGKVLVFSLKSVFEERTFLFLCNGWPDELVGAWRSCS